MSSTFFDFGQPERHVRLRPIIALTIKCRSLYVSLATQSTRAVVHDEPLSPSDSSFQMFPVPATEVTAEGGTHHPGMRSLTASAEGAVGHSRSGGEFMVTPDMLQQQHHMMDMMTGPTLPFKHGMDDSEGNYTAVIGELLDYGRYEVLAQAGQGSFGQVVRAHDRVTREEVAIKIIRNKPIFYNQACVELRLLQKMSSLDPQGVNGIVRVRHYFHHLNHLCIVFELLSINLYELLSITQYTGVSLNLVRKFGQQLLVSLAFLARPEINIIHCDIKPENVLLCDSKRSLIKLIDFGSSASADKPVSLYKYVQSRYYRSPEVILGLPYSFPIDMWSLGCLLVEMHVGSPLFDGKNELDQLVKIINYLGPPPQHMLAASNRMQKLCVQDADGRIVFVPEFERCITKRSLIDFIGVNTCGPNGARAGQRGHTESDYYCFYNLITRMLTYDPNERITPEEALQHPFFHRTRSPSRPHQTETPQIFGSDRATSPSSGSVSASLSYSPVVHQFP